jgi:hypothetical protein
MVREQIAGVWFEWDENKSERCRRQRGFNFSAVAQAFFDEYAQVTRNIVWQDEQRFQLVGAIPFAGVLMVIFVVRIYEEQESYRIISARQATKREEDEYWCGI